MYTTKVPASARDITAPAVPRKRYSRATPYATVEVENEPFSPALHAAWEAEINAKLAPAN